MLLEIQLFGDQQVNRRLLRFASNVEDASPAFEAIADELYRIEREQFNTEGKYGSGGWEPLADATIDAKLHDPDPVVRNNAHNILRATDALFKSLVDEHDPGNTKIVQPHQLVFGTSVPWAKYHQPDLQRRRELELPRRDRADAVRILQRHLLSEHEHEHGPTVFSA
jgi:hypothetical protein